jgi:hypothetical protein
MKVKLALILKEEEVAEVEKEVEMDVEEVIDQTNMNKIIIK